MEKRKSQPISNSSRKRRYLFLALLAIAILSIAIPIAVMFGKKKKAPTPKSDVLVPLYVYPSPGAWDPLFAVITAHPNINFTVVVNPASGPGLGPEPDANYTKEIPQLNSYANVRTVGYVSTDYTKRAISLALQDIRQYSAWSDNATTKGLDMHGVFLDETPTEYSPDSARYYQDIALAIKSDSGLGENPLIIHNPGQIPDARYLSSCDLTVVFEETYSTYQIYGFHTKISKFSKSSKVSREAFAAIIHGVPSTLSGKELDSFIKGVREVSGSIFLTGLSVDYYAVFWAGWSDFLRGMAA